MKRRTKEQIHEKETYTGTNHPQASAGGGLLGQGKKHEEVCRELGISDATFYKWRQKYGGMQVNQAKKLKQLEVENARLKQLVADQALDNKILKEVVEGKL